MTKEVTAYQIKIKLKGTDPVVWRELEVTSNMSLNNLAWALCLSMGWECYHFYLYQIGDRQYGDAERDDMCGWSCDRKIKVRDLVKQEVKTFEFIYDFGDGWQHEVKIIKEVQAFANKQYPVCTDGKNACPPEDCGGIGGFADYKDAIKNPKHPEHKEFLDWRGPYDPLVFDLKLTNLQMMAKKIPKNLKIKQLSSIDPLI